MAKRIVKKSGHRKQRYNLYKKKIKTVSLIVFTIIVLLSVAVFRFISYSNKKTFHSYNNNEYSHKYQVRGIDVSHHNSFIDWQQLNKEMITFVYLKSTEGSDHKDKEYKENYRLANNAGLKVGTYHFYIFGKDGKAQASHFISNSNIKSGDMIPAIDVEHSKKNKACTNQISHQRMIRELKILESEIFEKIGKRPVIYTNKECYRMYIKNHFPNNPLWICDLHNEPDKREFDQWKIWQFSHTGKIKGVIDDIDLNFFRGSFKDFEKLLIP